MGRNYVLTIYGGLCCENGQGSYELYYDNSLIRSGGEFDENESIPFGNGVYTCSPTFAPTSVPDCSRGTNRFELQFSDDGYDEHGTSEWYLKEVGSEENITSGNDYRDDIVVFGTVEETLTLGFVGILEELNDSEKT